MGKTALIAGSTGLVGRELLHILLDESGYDEVVSLVRRPSGLTHPKQIEVIVDFDKLQDYKEYFRVEGVFCCLGTTIKKAKTREAMYKVDVEYPLALAKIANEMGAEQFSVISSIGANPKSKTWYLKMKGELEEKLKKIGFTSLHIFRPSLLLGERKESRPGEKLAGVIYPLFSPIMIGSLKKYRGIQAKTVAASMYQATQKKNIGTKVYLSNEIEAITKK